MITNDASTSPALWEVRLAWALRVLIVATAALHVVAGRYLYALLCLGAIAALIAPPLLARTSRANVPVELELIALWGAVGDMTLGRFGGLYTSTVWFDKALHFGNSIIIGLVAFCIVYALRFTGRLRTTPGIDVVVILLFTLGIGALWEIVEYATDLMFHQGAQGSPLLSPLDDTMWDLILDGIGGAGGGLAGSMYLRHSRRSAARIIAYADAMAASPRSAGGRR